MQSRIGLFSIIVCVLASLACGSTRAATTPIAATVTQPPTLAPDAPTEASQPPTSTSVQPQEARVLRNLAYADLSDAQKLDLHLPAGNGPFPVIVFVHGGGWEHGDKRNPEASGIAAHFVNKGYAFATLNYRLSGEATFPAHIHDIKTAVRWLQAHAQEYRLDPDRFGGMGQSAGANLMSLLGTSCGVPELEGSDLGNADQSSCMKAVVDWFGAIDFLQMNEMLDPRCNMDHDAPDSPESKYLGAPIQEIPEVAQAANPITYITPDDPPFFIQHGTADCIAPYQQSQLFYDELSAVLGEDQVTLTFLEGAGHADPMFVTEENLQLSSAFFDSILK